MKVFVYGTLKPGKERWPTVEKIARNPDPIAVTAEGTIVDFGQYPGAIFAPGLGEVHGYIFELTDEESGYGIGILDWIEGVDSGLFKRVSIDVTDKDGGTYGAIAYEVGPAIRGSEWPIDNT